MRSIQQVVNTCGVFRIEVANSLLKFLLAAGLGWNFLGLRLSLLLSGRSCLLLSGRSCLLLGLLLSGRSCLLLSGRSCLLLGLLLSGRSCLLLSLLLLSPLPVDSGSGKLLLHLSECDIAFIAVLAALTGRAPCHAGQLPVIVQLLSSKFRAPLLIAPVRFPQLLLLVSEVSERFYAPLAVIVDSKVVHIIGTGLAFRLAAYKFVVVNCFPSSTI